MTPCRSGDVVLLPFPFTDLTTVKCGKLLTIDQRLIRKGLGRLPAQTLAALRQRVVTILE